MNISLILPTYNEAGSIVRLVTELRRVLDSIDGDDYEIIVVDDASPDGTGRIVVDTFGASADVRLIERSGPRGLAASVREGLEHACGRVLVVMDADFNHDPQALPSLLELVGTCDVVGGSRFLPGGGMDSRVRYVGSYLVNVAARAILRTPFRDNLSGYFAMRREVWESVSRDWIFVGYGDYYLRLLLEVQRRGLRVAEVPVFYRSRSAGSSKTPLVRTALRYGREILRLRVQDA